MRQGRWGTVWLGKVRQVRARSVKARQVRQCMASPVAEGLGEVWCGMAG